MIKVRLFWVLVMNKLLILFAGLFLVSASYAADLIEMTGPDDGTKYYVLPDTKTSNGVWVRFENPKFKSLNGDFISDAFLAFNCQSRSFNMGWVRAIDFNGQILFNEKLNESLAPVVPEMIMAQLSNYACRNSP